MKKYIQFVDTDFDTRLPQSAYINQQGLALCEDREACDCCGDPIISHFIKSSLFGIKVLINDKLYAELKEGGFKSWNLDTLYDLYQQGKCLFIGHLSFRIEDLEDVEEDYVATTIVTKEDGGIIELHVAGDRFPDLQSMISYTNVDFDREVASGDYYWEVID